MQAVIEEVRVGTFEPDATRGQRRLRGASKVPIMVQLNDSLACSTVELACRVAGRAVTDEEVEKKSFDDDFTGFLDETDNSEHEDEKGTGETLKGGVSSDDGLTSSSESEPGEGCPPAGEDDKSDAELALKAAARVSGLVSSPKDAPRCADVSVVLRHAVRKTVHYGHLSDEDRLGCGRPRTCGYVLMLEESPEMYWPQCRDCFP